MENNYDKSGQISDNSVNNEVDYSTSSATIPVSQVDDQSNQSISEVSEEYVGGKWYQKSWGKVMIAMAILILILISLLVYFILSNFGALNSNPQVRDGINNLFDNSSLSSTTLPATVASTTTNQINPIVKDSVRLLAEKMNRPYWGNASSSLVIVEFADFQCSVCEAEFPTIRAFVTKHKDEVLYIFRNYIVIDDNSKLLAQASLCANDQGKFWILHDKLYTNFGSVTSMAELQSLIQSLGMDWNKMSDCIQSGKYNGQVAQDISDGQSLGIQGTPTFFINGKKIEGAVSASDWELILAKFKQINSQK